MVKKYVVQLMPEERQELESLVKRGKAAAWKIKRANALLQCDQSEEGPGWSDEQIAIACRCTTRSLENWRKQAVEQGPMSLLERKPRPPVEPFLDGEQEAQLVKLACSTPPDEAGSWTLRLLAEKLMELEVIESISHETVRRVLKKRNQALA